MTDEEDLTIEGMVPEAGDGFDDLDDYRPGGAGLLRDALIQRARTIVPFRRVQAAAHVYLDDDYYAPFQTLESANQAAALMAERWATVAGRNVRVVRG